MKKTLIFLSIMLCLSISTGCMAQDNNVSDATSKDIQTSMKEGAASSKADRSQNGNTSYETAYKNLLSFKSKDYSKSTVDEFNQLLTSTGDLSVLFEDYSTVVEKITEDDENYDFITITLNASLDEIFCKELNDETGFECCVMKRGKPTEPLNEEEQKILEAEPIYDFQFYASCNIHYQITDKTITVEERDEVLKTFRDDLQSYVDTLSEEEIENGNVKELLEKMAQKIAGNLDTKKMNMDFDVQTVSVAGNGMEVEG